MDKRLASLFVALITCLFLNTKIKAQGTVTDIDGNTYQTVVIGSQEWMAEDLKVTKYRNGDAILTDQSHNQWQQSTEGIWTYYDNDPANNDLYGKLYNWYATVDSRGLCPTGWRTPTDNDWQILELFIDPNLWGNRNNVGKKLKSRRQVNSPFGGEYNTTEHPRWDDHPVNYGTDEYDFNSLPGGGYTNGNAFRHKGKEAYYWSSTEAIETHAWTRILLFSNLGSSRGQLKKSLGASVRCIKGDDQSIQVPQVNTLPASNISTNSVTCEGEVFSDGGAAVTERGIVWSTNQNPNIDNNQGITSEGSGLGNFLSEISGLNPGTTYWVRAYATNSEGNGYGVQIKLVTLTSIGIPTVSTSQVNNTTSSAAVSGGNVISEGGATVTSRGIVWSTSQNPSLETNEGFTTDGSGAGVFYSSLSNLTPQTVYYVKAYATNSEGTSYGNEVSFETTEEVVVTTNTIIVKDASAVSGSEVTIEVEMENQSDIVAFQMDFVLPEGFSYVNGSYTLSNRSQEHTPGQSILTGNVLRVLAYSAVNSSFTGNSGILFTFKLATPQTVGTWELNSTNVNLTNTDFENVFDEAQSGTLTLYESSPNGQPCPGIPTVTDIDGNVYNTVQIGDQCWMKENLRVTHYNNYDPIITDLDNNAWGSTTEGAYSIPPYPISGITNSEEMLNAYGALYNWYAVNNSNGICPSGWKVPRDEDWIELTTFTGSEISPNGNKLKSCRQIDSPMGNDCSVTEHPRWNYNDLHYGTDSYGFRALPNGSRGTNGGLNSIGNLGGWWTSTFVSDTRALMYYLSYQYGNIVKPSDYKSNGFGVRCIKESNSSSTSKWTEVQPAGDIYGDWKTAMNSDGTVILAGDFGGRLYISRDIGNNWVEIQPAGDVTRGWTTISTSSDGNYIVAGYSDANMGNPIGRLFISRDRGYNWEEIQPAGNFERGWNASSLNFDGSVIVVGTSWDYGRIFKSTDGGYNWIELQPDGDNNRVWRTISVSEFGNNLIASCTNGCTTVFISDDEGQSWQSINPSIDNTVNPWVATAINNDGSNIFAALSNSRLFQSNDFGLTWFENRPQGVDVGRAWGKISMNPDGSIILISTSDYNGSIYLSKNSGNNWEDIKPGFLGDVRWYSSAMNSNATIIIASSLSVSYGGRLYIYKE